MKAEFKMNVNIGESAERRRQKRDKIAYKVLIERSPIWF